MDSTTLLGVVGIGGTLLGTVIGAVGALGAARIASRTQVTTEEQKARRQAYGACATAFLARQDAVFALVKVVREEAARNVIFDPATGAAVEARLQAAEEMRDAVARAVGLVMVEGPYAVSHRAERSARAIEDLFGVLRAWSASIASGRDSEPVPSYHFLALSKMSDVRESLDSFTNACRVVLRPLENRHPLFPARWTRRFSRARQI
ncbi:hypothetical protein [Streptomyces sp. NPDC003483]